MGDPRYRRTPGALAFDAFYRDEWGAVNDAGNCTADHAERQGFHKNRFTSVFVRGSRLVESAQTFQAPVRNVADPRINRSLKDRSNPVPAGAPERFTAHVYVGDAVLTYWQQALRSGAWTEPLVLTLYFGVGTELNRHGLRSFFQNATGLRGIIQIPGIEPRRGEPRYGICPDAAGIAALLREFFGLDVPHRITVLAAFSTGSCGLNQALLNELVPLSDVERLVFYDCLYAQQCGSTAAAVARLKARAGGKLRIVVYKASEGANSFATGSSALQVVQANPGLIDSRGLVENLYQNPHYIALVVHRALEAAVLDGVVRLDATTGPPFEAMRAALAAVPRGTMVSNKSCFGYVHGRVPRAGITFFEDWSRAHARTLAAFYAKVGRVSANGSFRQLLWGNSLPGWPGGDGEDKHDLLLPEFGWEYLPG